MNDVKKLPDGSKVYCDSQVESCGLDEIFVDKVYEKHFKLEQGMKVLDAGACVGAFTLKAAKIVEPEGLVVAVEPHWESFGWLIRNVMLNRYDHVRCFNVALSDRVGTERLHVGWLGATSLMHDYRYTNQDYDAGTVTVDYLSDLLNVKFDFIKVDVEGAEVKILNGFNLQSDVTMAIESHECDVEVKSILEQKGFDVLIEQRQGMPNMVYAHNM